MHCKRLFPLPCIDDLLHKLRNAKCMTHLDVRSAFKQVRMADDGPQDDFIAATAFQGLIPNGESCLLEILVIGVWPLQCPCHIFPTYEPCVGTVY